MVRKSSLRNWNSPEIRNLKLQGTSSENRTSVFPISSEPSNAEDLTSAIANDQTEKISSRDKYHKWREQWKQKIKTLSKDLKKKNFQLKACFKQLKKLEDKIDEKNLRLKRNHRRLFYFRVIHKKQPKPKQLNKYLEVNYKVRQFEREKERLPEIIGEQIYARVKKHLLKSYSLIDCWKDLFFRERSLRLNMKAYIKEHPSMFDSDESDAEKAAAKRRKKKKKTAARAENKPRDLSFLDEEWYDSPSIDNVESNSDQNGSGKDSQLQMEETNLNQNERRDDSQSQREEAFMNQNEEGDKNQSEIIETSSDPIESRKFSQFEMDIEAWSRANIHDPIAEDLSHVQVKQEIDFDIDAGDFSFTSPKLEKDFIKSEYLHPTVENDISVKSEKSTSTTPKIKKTNLTTSDDAPSNVVVTSRGRKVKRKCTDDEIREAIDQLEVYNTTSFNLGLKKPKSSHKRFLECIRCYKPLGVFSRNHMLEDHGPEFAHLCPFCDETSIDNMTIHISNIHFHRPLLQCRKCIRTFFSERGLSNHLFQHTHKLKFRCHKCHRYFSEKENLEKHVCKEKKIRNIQIICDICGKQIYGATEGAARSNLRSHRMRRHIEKNANHEVYTCKICKRNFPRLTSLNNHSKVHSNFRPYLCTFEGCGKSFKCSNNLVQHQAFHDAPKFNCACGKRFFFNYALKKHKLTCGGD